MTVKLTHLSFGYDGAEILKDLTLSIPDGDFIGILGRNGSGKTTLVKLLLGLLKPSRGSIELFGQPSNRFADWSLLGYVPQRYTIDKAFPASVDELLDLREGREKARIVKRLAIRDLLPKKFAELSGGQQQRVLIAMCLLSNPRLLILDEPDAGVDLKAQYEFHELLKELNAEFGVTIILVTHEVELVAKYAKRVVFLSDGRLHAEGPAQDAYRLLTKVYGKGVHPLEHR